MTVPTFDKFIEPILRYLATHPEGVPAGQAHEAAAATLALTDEQRQLRVPSGMQPVYKNRAGWAHDRLKRAGLSTSPRHGWWKITTHGQQLIASNPIALPDAVMADILSSFIDRPLEELDRIRAGGAIVEASVEQQQTTSPEDRLEAALSEIRNAVAVELLELLSRVTPTYFETVVLDVLHRCGYGATRDELKRVGGSGDAGIDGIISLDRLGLERVYVQAKRWQANVGRPQVQEFYGALAGQRATKGVFITTSLFTQQALDFARSVERIVLVDGHMLAQLMIEREVGVSGRTIKVPKIDGDYFDE